MNIYERILNILLEARVEMFIQDRLDEASPMSRADRIKKTDAKLASAKPGTGRAEQLMKNDPTQKASRTLGGSKSMSRQHVVNTGRGGTKGGGKKKGQHIKPQTSRQKRAITTITNNK